MIQKNYIPNLPQIPFRTGKYEGIVMHSTAVYGDNALGERSYECSHYKEAFVHAFSDPLGTIETANPAFIAYGAGHVANYRYLHSELCQVKNDGSDKANADFEVSYGNWVNYAAQRLYDLKLGVIPATADGKGTVWQHYQVTEWLGDSTHIDPMDYLSTWHVTWAEVIRDIQNKYKELEKDMPIDQANGLIDTIHAYLPFVTDQAIKDKLHVQANYLRLISGQALQ